MNPIYVLLFILPIVYFIHKYKNKSKRSLPPSPPKLPIIGNLHQLGGIPHRFLYYLSEKHGPLISLQLGELTGLVVSSPEMAEKIMKKHNLVFANRPKFIATRKLSYDFVDAVFSSCGDEWRNTRKLSVVHLLNSKRILSLQSVIDEEVDEMVCKIKAAASSEGASVNLSKIFLSLGSDIMCRIIFGKKYFGTDETRIEGGLKGLLVEIQAMFMGFFVGDYFPALWWVDILTGMRNRLDKAFMIMDSFFEQEIDEHNDPQRPKHEMGDFIDAMIRAQEDNKRQPPLTRDIVKSLLMNMFVAGSDTSAGTLEWAMSELIRNPCVLAKAQSELRDSEGRTFAQGADHQHGPDDHYLEMVLKETFRLHPPAPLLVLRESSQDCTVDGYHIPKGTIVYINAWAIGRDPKHWENHLDFQPERFSNNKVDMNGRDFKLIPFGAGRRICPGDQLGLSMTRTALATFLREFDWELPVGICKEEVDMDEVIGITTLRKTPLHLIPKTRTLAAN